ncbi:ADP-ribosylglycohydrolase family protein [Microbacterium elymi]|uniref:ADP-ribosylglycohydrolase family protein n=1 Tax=Microbacterium elymi TaxID=2909587 RepID=A0ABY5NHM1_9MICO|nr:ADP-ribosylglycohydrolase family protein [Microbacterium elymi]UUT34629.1 ADP-ribosylglycohydrolase family protein [Microbacterium elymi]
MTQTASGSALSGWMRSPGRLHEAQLVEPEDLVAQEIVASRDEGRDVAAVAEAWTAVGGVLEVPRNGASAQRASDESRAVAVRLLDELDALPMPADPRRPEGFDQIIAAAPDVPRLAAVSGDIEDRIHGAWLGRAAGCLLGKPVEKIPPEGIRELLTSAGRWPLDFYFTAEGVAPDSLARWPWNRRSAPTSLVENIDGMPEDDDLNYPLLNLALVERIGRRFTVEDVAEAWLAELPAGRVFTAERAAYRNLLEGIDPEGCARVRNPFREWIGALIRGDVFGWISPGDPREAARMAFEDARLSHTGNGLYGELWAAGLAAAAVVGDDVETVLDAASAVVPASSGLADAVAFGRRLGHSGGTLDDDLAALAERYAGVHWVHVVNNAATIAWALTRGGGRLERACALAVMAGWDTDSVGATVGGVCGAIAGARALPASWTAPLHDRIATSLPGLDGVAISEVARRTTALAVGKEEQ